MKNNIFFLLINNQRKTYPNHKQPSFYRFQLKFLAYCIFFVIPKDTQKNTSHKCYKRNSLGVFPQYNSQALTIQTSPQKWKISLQSTTMQLRQVLLALILLMTLIFSTHASLSQCCCSTINGGAQGLQTSDYTFAFQYSVSYLNLAANPQAYIKLLGRLPKAMTLPVWIQYHRFNSFIQSFASAPIDPDIQTTFPQNCINFNSVINTQTDLSLSTVSPLTSDKSLYFSVPDYDNDYTDDGQLTPQELDPEQISMMGDQVRNFKKKNTAGNFFWVVDNAPNNPPQVVTTINNYYCTRGYLKKFKTRIAQMPTESNNYTTLMTNLMDITLPTEYGLDSTFYTRWMAMFIFAKFQSQNMTQYVCPPNTNSTSCNNLC